MALGGAVCQGDSLGAACSMTGALARVGTMASDRPKTRDEERAARLARALRDNLGRRKAQARARVADEADTPDEANRD